MLCRMYGHPDAAFFSGTTVCLMYAITVHGTRFNWANVIMAALKSNINVALATDDSFASELYMASYFLDEIFARCSLDRWVQNWVVEKRGPIHKHLRVFWDSQYK